MTMLISEVSFMYHSTVLTLVRYDTSVHLHISASHQIESISAGIWCKETSQEETNKHKQVRQ